MLLLAPITLLRLAMLIALVSRDSIGMWIGRRPRLASVAFWRPGAEHKFHIG
jgi:hypothetical protein